MKRPLNLNFRSFMLILLVLFVSSQIGLAQTGTIKGTISDVQGMALPGANIHIKAINTGAVSNTDGFFQLTDIPLGKQIIEVSFIGYVTKTKTVTVEEGKTTELSFSLDEGLLIGEVMVTASKRSERIQDVPSTISAITSKGIEEQGITSTDQYLETIPGLYIRSTTPAVNTVTIRGVTPMGGWAQSVGYYLGETPLPFLPGISSFDVERIEVLRGPQGTLYGEGSMGGTIIVIPNAANTNKFEAEFNPEISSTTGGGFNYYTNGMINVPIIKDKLAVRATGFYQNDDGYIKNVGLDLDNVNTFSGYGARFSARYFATNKLMITASAIFNKSENGNLFVANEDYETTSSLLENGTQNYQSYSLSADYDFSFATLTVTGSYFNNENTIIQDLAGLLPTVNYILSLGGIDPRTELWTPGANGNDVYSAEVRLVSSSAGPLKWTTGLFYKDDNYSGTLQADTEPHLDAETIENLMEFGFGIPGVTELYDDHFSHDVQQYSLFGEVSYDITSKFNVLAGVRLMHEKRYSSVFTDGMFPILMTGLAPELREESADENVLNPKFVISYKPTNNILLYLNASKGFRSGGQNLYTFMFPGTNDTYGSESLWNYEFGLKSSFLNGKLIANAAFFYNDWTNMQVVTRSISDFNLNENVGKAHTAGIDAEISWMPINNLLITGSGNYIKAVTDVDIITPAGVNPDTGEELFNTVPAGTQLPNIPEFSFDIAAQYKFAISDELTLTPRVSYNYKGKDVSYYINMLDPKDIPSYGLTNFRLTFERKGISAYLYANNLTNEKVINSYYIDDPDLGNLYRVGSPRTIGLGLRLKF